MQQCPEKGSVIIFQRDARKKGRYTSWLQHNLPLSLRFSGPPSSCTFLLAPSGATSSQTDEKSLNQFSKQLHWHCFSSMTGVRRFEEKHWQGMRFLLEILMVSLHALVINNLNQLEMINFLRDYRSYVGQQRNAGLNLALRVLILCNYLPQNLFINYLCQVPEFKYFSMCHKT